MIEQEVSFEHFADMAPFKGDEAASVLLSLHQERAWEEDLARLIPRDLARELSNQWAKTNTIEVFQETVVKPFLEGLMSQTTAGVTWNFHPSSLKEGMLFLSNHRDIVLDPSLVNVALLEEKRGSTEIGIGSNLLSSPWVNQLVRLNRCFVVERSGSARDRYNHSLRTAAYIQHVIGNGTPVWLAHREGRAKDGRDETAPALIRTLSNNCDPDTWNALNVVPVSISYEWDPCDAMKVNEVLHRMKYGSYEKAQGEDELSMWTGLAGQKGRVHIEFGEVVKWETHLEERKPERGMATKFDESLMCGMKIWPNQLLASEALGREATTRHSEEKPSEMDRQAWNLRKRNIEDSLSEMGWSRELAAEAWCKMLAAPLELRRSLLND